jgi:hypothetical protein
MSAYGPVLSTCSKYLVHYELATKLNTATGISLSVTIPISCYQGLVTY